jgi:hypothetical protein
MKKLNTRNILIITGATAVTLLIGVPAFAATATTTTAQHIKGTHKFSGVFGTVTAINGSTVTVTNPKGTAYIVDAANAVVQKGIGKNAQTLALTNIAVNDKVAVEGAVTGTAVVATKIDDGVTPFAHAKLDTKLTNAAFGTVSAVNGSTISLSHKTKTGTANVTVDTTSTTVFKMAGNAAVLSDVSAGERMVAMGTKDASGNITAATTVRVFKGATK